jgi:hypothetical protein
VDPALAAIRAASVAILFLVLSSPIAGAQPAEHVDPTVFAAELQRISDQLAAGEPGRVPEVALPTGWIVEAGSQRIEVSTHALRRTIENARRDPASWPAQRRNLLVQIAALRAEARAYAVRHADHTAANTSSPQETLNTILSGAEFRRIHDRSALARLRQRASKWLLDVWQRLGGAALGRRSTAIVFAWFTALVALGVLAVWLARVIQRSGQGRQFGLRAPTSKGRSARAWARDALNATDPREAMRYAYRATVCGLEEEGTWRLDDARTPREYLRMLPAEHRRRAPVSDVIRRFEEVWFAAREATADDKATAIARLRELGCLPAE